MCWINEFVLFLAFGAVLSITWFLLLAKEAEEARKSFSKTYPRAKIYYELYRCSNQNWWSTSYRCKYLNKEDCEIIIGHNKKYLANAKIALFIFGLLYIGTVMNFSPACPTSTA